MDEAQKEKETKQFLALFVMLMQNVNDEEGLEEALQELASYRSELMILRAISPFDIDKDELLQILRNTNDNYLTQFEKDRRDRLIKAVENIIEFCTCAEYQAAKEIELLNEEDDIDLSDIQLGDMPEDSEDDDNDLLPYWLVNRDFNGTYRDTEEADAEYAMGMCYAWLKYGDDEMLTYMTQEDDRVRPWHYALQGFSARKSEFPAWMIPPIEWRCRCFLLTSEGGLFASVNEGVKTPAHKITQPSMIEVRGSIPKRPKELDGVFEESICTGGRIFSDKHGYFSIDKNDKEMLDRIVNNIKEKWYGRES